jgi:hypothetical protein
MLDPVEYHLHKVFAKLDIGSRVELELVLPGPGSATNDDYRVLRSA